MRISKLAHIQKQSMSHCRQRPMSLLAAAFVMASLAACSSDSGPGHIPELTVLNNEGRVVIDGELIVGEVLTARIIDPDGSSNPAFQWAADSADIMDATMSTFTLTEDELGKSMTVSVRYTDSSAFLEVHTSTPTPAVLAEANVEGAITIVGVPTLGQTLTASISDGNGLDDATPAYTWLSNGVEIAGANAETYVLQLSDVGTDITVAATYTDDVGFDESVVSPPLGPISETAVNVPGVISIAGAPVVGQTLTAVINDANGVPASVAYQWAADNTPIAGATNSTFVPTAEERRTTISVSASYVDEFGFTEAPSADAGDITYSAIVTGGDSLLAAAMTATTGDVIGLAEPAGGENYNAMPEIIFAVDDLLVQRTAGSEAVISGTFCIVVSGSRSVIDGLLFENINLLTGTGCDSNGDSSVYLTGAENVLRNCEFRSEAADRTISDPTEPQNYISLKGINHLIERNLFSGKDMTKEGSVITMFADTDDTNRGHIIQYNYFNNLPGVEADRISTAHAIQAGRSTGGDALGDGEFTIQYNLFNQVLAERRIIRVQSGANTIHGNTILGSTGEIALEDGYGNTVTQNVIIGGGSDPDEGGIVITPLGHVVTDNYIGNLSSGRDRHGGLFISGDPLSGSGNRAIFNPTDPADARDLTTVVARNSVVNARQAWHIDSRDCAIADYDGHLVDFDDNLVFNQTSGQSIYGNTNGSGRAALRDSEFVAASCAFNAGADFDGNHVYSDTLSASGQFDFNGAAVADNVVGAQDFADFSVDRTVLLNAGGAAAGIGVDTSILNIIDSSQVGPGSTWVAQ